MIISAGYSVFEVLMAFSIMALVLTVLIPGQSSLLARAVNADDVLLATDFAASRLDALAVSEPLTNGRVEFAYRDWDIVQTTEFLEALPGDATMLSVTIAVHAQVNGREIASLSSVKIIQ